MKIAVLGATGFGGSPLSLELLARGHQVLGLSRQPEKLGQHANYTPHPLDISTASITQLVDVFRTQDVVVNAYNPAMGPELYKSFIETIRRILLAVKTADVSYLISIGGTGSLALDASQPFTTFADSREAWLAYRRATADSEAATYHMEERIGFGSPGAQAMRNYRTARIALHQGKLTADDEKVIKETEEAVLSGPNPIPDLPLAARATFLFFEGNTSFRWSFVSPPGQYRPGPRTGNYETVMDVLPLAPAEAAGSSKDGNAYEGRLLGISAADLGVAIADEVEKQEKVERHWSAVAELPSDERMASYARLS